ncbi:hypothetical protein DS745_18630 [Anaerobacillus alkaliphilus]|uniref:Uncharacterized protein n=1 Tax=Anaerobacillus alkaliphilus TaxID=1548597 RepID=A0A4Q0VQF0_9BACI|nr:hypothetical protein DS745_18630 [Anaerobacillus alkaliphilus]
MCIEIALDVQKLHEQGVSLVDIRNYIDESYSKFAEPTPTPHPHGH